MSGLIMGGIQKIGKHDINMKNILNANNAHLKSLYYMAKLSNSMCILNVTCRDAEVESELY